MIPQPYSRVKVVVALIILVWLPMMFRKSILKPNSLYGRRRGCLSGGRRDATSRFQILQQLVIMEEDSSSISIMSTNMGSTNLSYLHPIHHLKLVSKFQSIVARRTVMEMDHHLQHHYQLHSHLTQLPNW